MTKRTRNILIVLGGVVLIFAGIAAYGAYSIYSFFSQLSSFEKEMPEEIKEPRVLTGPEFLKKKDFFTLTSDGVMSAVRKASEIPDEAERQKQINASTARGIFSFSDLKVFGSEIIAVGKFGSYVFDLDGNLKREILFDPEKVNVKLGPIEAGTYQANVDNLSLVRLSRDKYGFLSYGSIQGVRIFDENGHAIWSYGREDLNLSSAFKSQKEQEEAYEKSRYVMEATVGDLDNDGVSEYIVARKSDGIHAFGQDGSEKWFAADDFPSDPMVVVDLDGDGRNELVQIGKTVRDSKGNKLKDLRGSSNDATLFVSDAKNRITIERCNIFELKITCRDDYGKELLKGPAPLGSVKTKSRRVEIPGNPEMSFDDDSEDVYHPKAVWVTLQKDKPKYLAVLASYISLPRSNLYVYEPSGNLVYHELIGEEAETIAVRPADNGAESLIVGGKNTIWFYSAN